MYIILNKNNISSKSDKLSGHASLLLAKQALENEHPRLRSQPE